MIYSKLYLQKKTSLVPLLVVGGICLILLILVIRSQNSAYQQSIVHETLNRHELVNLTSNQVGIFWESKSSEEGWVQYGEGKDALSIIAYDERDVVPLTQSYIYHYAILKNLKENTDYHYQIVSKKGAYLDRQAKPFFVRTPSQNGQRYSLKPAYGKVILANGAKAQNIFVMLKVEDKKPLLVLTKATGEWLIPLHILIDKMSGKIVSEASDSLKTEMEFLGEGMQNSIVTSSLADITPLQQTIVLGKNYSLMAKGEILSASDKNSLATNKPVFFVSYPIENAIVPAAHPLINGGGIVNRDVYVFINSKPQFAFRTTVDKNGEWRVLPKDPIGAGSYTATITSQDARGGKITTQRHFTIAKSGEQVLGIATGEPTLVPTLQTVTPSPTMSIQPTPIPSLTLSVTQAPSPTVTNGPTPTMTYPTAQPTREIPRTGGGPSIPIFTSFSLIIMGVGLMLVF